MVDDGDVCDVCREPTKYPGFNPKARLLPGCVLGPACFKRVYDKYRNGKLTEHAVVKLNKIHCGRNKALRYENWSLKDSCLHALREKHPGKFKVNCSLCGFMEAARKVNTSKLKIKQYNAKKKNPASPSKGKAAAKTIASSTSDIHQSPTSQRMEIDPVFQNEKCKEVIDTFFTTGTEEDQMDSERLSVLLADAVLDATGNDIDLSNMLSSLPQTRDSRLLPELDGSGSAPGSPANPAVAQVPQRSQPMTSTLPGVYSHWRPDDDTMSNRTQNTHPELQFAMAQAKPGVQPTTGHNNPMTYPVTPAGLPMFALTPQQVEQFQHVMTNPDVQKLNGKELQARLSQELKWMDHMPDWKLCNETESLQSWVLGQAAAAAAANEPRTNL